ncbi:MAG: DUF4325 domain-containing protein [bacterium]|nr:DUF4325 domain-containing protein [bacterium]
MTEINIGKSFSSTPAGRYYSDGDSSGEKFREEVLWPTLKTLKPNEKLKVIIDDNVEGYGSSFLVEGFAGVVKHGYMEPTSLLRTIEIVYSDPDFEFYKDKINQYIKEAKFNSIAYKRNR